MKQKPGMWTADEAGLILAAMIVTGLIALGFWLSLGKG